MNAEGEHHHPSSSAVLQLRSIPDPLLMTYTLAVVALSWWVIRAWNAPSRGRGLPFPYVNTFTHVGVSFGFSCICLRTSLAIRLMDAPLSMKATVSSPLILMSHLMLSSGGGCVARWRTPHGRYFRHRPCRLPIPGVVLGFPPV